MHRWCYDGTHYAEARLVYKHANGNEHLILMRGQIQTRITDFYAVKPKPANSETGALGLGTATIRPDAAGS